MLELGPFGRGLGGGGVGVFALFGGEGGGRWRRRCLGGGDAVGEEEEVAEFGVFFVFRCWR